MRPLTHCICRKTGVNVNIWFPSRASDWSPLRWAEISRERPLAEALRRCDALAVAVGLIDRKHVGVVGANRDAAAAKGVPASRPHMSTFKYTRLSVCLPPPPPPTMMMMMRWASFHLKTRSKRKGNRWMLWPTVRSRSAPPYCVWFSQRHLDETAGTTRSVVAMEPTVSRLKPLL